MTGEKQAHNPDDQVVDPATARPNTTGSEELGARIPTARSGSSNPIQSDDVGAPIAPVSNALRAVGLGGSVDSTALTSDPTVVNRVGLDPNLTAAAWGCIG